MQSFLTRHQSQIKGVLNGFDRVRFRGTIRWLANQGGMMGFLNTIHVPLKGFKQFAVGITEEMRKTTAAIAETTGCRHQYLYSSQTRKEDVARQIAQEDGVTHGLICVLDCVEPCWSYRIDRNPERKRLELRQGYSKCLHRYFYFQHPVFGFMHVRLQTWFPFTVHICLNGREWLARMMDADGIGYLRRENCFTDIADFSRAGRLMDQQLRVNWPLLLDGLETTINPARPQLLSLPQLSYYWSVESSEWATDITFRSRRALAALYPQLIRHAMQTFSSKEVMRFLGRKVPAGEGRYGKFGGEVASDVTDRCEGMRIKHRVGKNSLKMYDKYNNARVETTMNEPRDFKVYRTTEADPEGPAEWRRLRRGVADIHRRAAVSQAANERYLEALAAVDPATTLGQCTTKLSESKVWNKQRVRGLNVFAKGDLTLLEAVSRGEFKLNGFRNRDLRPLLYGPDERDPAETRRNAGRITRQLRLLQAHGLIRKVAKTHRYLLTKRGTKTITAILLARQADAEKLRKLAA